MLPQVGLALILRRRINTAGVFSATLLIEILVIKFNCTSFRFAHLSAPRPRIHFYYTAAYLLNTNAPSL